SVGRSQWSVAVDQQQLAAGNTESPTFSEVIMKQNSTRRDFLKVSMGAVCAAPLASESPAANSMVAGPGLADGRMKKAVQIYMLPKTLSYSDRFKLARDVGFEGVEGQTVEDPNVAEEIRKASEDAALPIHSVMNMAHWKYPLSSRDPAVVKKSLEGMTASLHNARLWGAETVLLVPGVLDADISYQDAWTRSQANIRTLIPLAEELKVIIAIEEVWNKFLLSPLEMAKYVDEFQSPWIKQYFDVGNVVLYGYPQDWIRTQGKRIAKVSNRNAASARASSVLPTPVGPRKMKLPTGRSGSFSPERARITASATAVTASSCPITRLCSSSSRWRIFRISPSSSLVTGTPVQRLTTSAISSSSTSSLIILGPAKVLANFSFSSASCFSRPTSLPYFSSAARLRS